MALNTCKMWFNDIKIAFSFQKITKNYAAAWGGAPDPVCDSFELLYFSQHVSWFRRFRFLTFVLNRLPLAKSWLSAKPGYVFWSSILRYHSPTKSFTWKISDDFIACDLRFGSPSPSKNPGYANARSPYWKQPDSRMKVSVENILSNMTFRKQLKQKNLGSQTQRHTTELLPPRNVIKLVFTSFLLDVQH